MAIDFWAWFHFEAVYLCRVKFFLWISFILIRIVTRCCLCNLCGLNWQIITVHLGVDKPYFVFDSYFSVSKAKSGRFPLIHYLNLCYWAKSSEFIIRCDANSIFWLGIKWACCCHFWTGTVTCWPQSIFEGFSISFPTNCAPIKISHLYRIASLWLQDASLFIMPRFFTPVSSFYIYISFL